MNGGSIIGLVFATGFLLFVVLTYNRLVARKNHVLEAWSGVDVQLKRRHDLLPKLVDVVKTYGRYEQQVLHDLTGLRAMQNQEARARTRAENAITGSLRQLFAVAEAYPELKANASYLDLQTQISAVEEQIQYARRYLNGTVRELNILVESFPSNLIARTFGFSVMDYFEIDLATQREDPKIDLS